MYRSETKTALHKNILYFIRWTAISIVMGTVCGLIGTAFGYGVIYAQRLFKTHSFMLYLMPVAGVLIVLLHQMFHELGNRGTNLILESISSDERIPMATLPCIFISTILSQAVEKRERPYRSADASEIISAMCSIWMREIRKS